MFPRREDKYRRLVMCKPPQRVIWTIVFFLSFEMFYEYISWLSYMNMGVFLSTGIMKTMVVNQWF